jgi:hypothetical protein
MEVSMKTAVDEAQINRWKNQYGESNVFSITVPLDDLDEKKVTGYFRKPDLKVIQASTKFVDTDPVKAGLIQLDTCFLGGDEEFTTNDEVKMSAIKALNTVFKVRVAEIKNL